MHTFKTPKGTELPMSDIKGKDYLLVAHRLVWFREEHPDWGIETQELHFDKTHAKFRAVIKDATGRIIGDGNKTARPGGIGEYYEKAQTGAIGRALAICGFGTQFAPDLEEGDVVDSPIERHSAGPTGSAGLPTVGANQPGPAEKMGRRGSDAGAVENEQSHDQAAPASSHEPANVANERWEPPEEENPPVCALCKSKLIKSKYGPKLYCPKYKDKSKGTHTEVML